jgi:hypothetical protein
MPLDQIDPCQAAAFPDDSIGHYFERLRRDAPVHLARQRLLRRLLVGHPLPGHHGVDTHHAVFSSDWTNGGITLFNAPMDEQLPMFIAMDPPKHDDQRKAVSPIVAPANLASMEALIRERTGPRAGQPAAQRALRLGGQGVDRADHADAGHAVRLSVRRPPQAHPLVGRGHLGAQGTDKIPTRMEPAARWPSWARCWPTSPSCGTSASTPRRGPTWCRCWRTARPRAT